MISFRAGPTATTAKLDGTCVNPLHPDLQVLADATLVLKCKEGGRRGGGGQHCISSWAGVMCPE